jgi:hypothetical protein
MVEERHEGEGAWRRNRGLRGRIRRAGASMLLALRIPTTPWRALPDFVIVGAQKAGTTSFYAALCQHPDVRRAFRKEVHYFDTPHYPNLGWYRRHFPFDRDGVLTGESSPYYIFHPAVPARIAETVPKVSLIAILRDPITRAISQYHHARKWQFEERSIDEALDPEHQDALASDDDVEWWDRFDCPARQRAYLARGHYADQLERWFAVFPREQILVLESSELDGGTAVPAAHRFLGLSAHETPALPRQNVGSYAPTDPGIIRVLSEYFAPHNARLEKLLGRSFDWR